MKSKQRGGEDGRCPEYRIVVCGDHDTGKSAISTLFVQGKFHAEYDPTIEDSYRKNCEVDGEQCILDIMDTAGQEEYSALRDEYLKTGDGFVLVYVPTAPSSFRSIQQRHYKQLKKFKEYNEEERQQLPVVLVANEWRSSKDTKATEEGEERVSMEEAMALAERLGFGFVQVTNEAKSAQVAEVFMEVARRVKKFRASSSSSPSSSSSSKERCVMC
ncbi:Ras-related protein Rap-1A [Balamuthia mandrillaris]